MPATQILVIGDQGTGKSTAWESMDPETTLIISPNSKPLPWPGSAKQYIVGKNRIQTNKLVDIPTVLNTVNNDLKHIKAVLVEDLTHFYNARTTSSEFMARKLGNDAFAKWGELASDIARVIALGETYRDDLTIVYNGHTEMHDTGIIAMLSPGKLLDKDIKPPSYFTYVLHSLVVNSDKNIEYRFLTNKNGTHDAKTPKGCFTELLIPNDMNQVIKTIHNYQNGN
jgi:hypothetical protein